MPRIPQPETDSRQVEIIDLREVHDEGLLGALYQDLFLSSFPLPEEQDDPTRWLSALWGNRRDSPSILHVLVIGLHLHDEVRRSIWGFIFASYRKTVEVGFISYIAVRAEQRRKGIGRLLLRRAIEQLESDASRNGQVLRAVLAEVNDPTKVSRDEDSIDPRERILIMEKLGARLVPVPYVQPELRAGRGRSERMRLVVFPIDEEPFDLLSTSVLHDFLYMFYKGLGIEDPSKDPDFLKMCSSLQGNALQLQPVTLMLDKTTAPQ